MTPVLLQLYNFIKIRAFGWPCERGEGSPGADLIGTVKTGRKVIGHATMTKLCTSLRMRKELKCFVKSV